MSDDEFIKMSDEVDEIGRLADKLALMARRLSNFAKDCSAGRADPEVVRALTGGVAASVANIAKDLQTKVKKVAVKS
jgi:hypothetical protein